MEDQGAKTPKTTPHEREIFYVGGRWIQDAKGGKRFGEQMYVERLIPTTVNDKTVDRDPIIFIHGATRSGVDWLTKPDGRPGWASYFLSQGFECYLVDLPFRGRSPWHPEDGELITFPAESVQKLFAAGQEYGSWPQAKLHTQWPGTGAVGDPFFDHFSASTLQMLGDIAKQEAAAQAACAALLDRIGKPAVVLGHSAGGSTPWLLADARPKLVRCIIALEPTGPPFVIKVLKPGPGSRYGIASAPLTYDPPVTDPDVDLIRAEVKGPGENLIDCFNQAPSPPPRQLVNLKGIPVVVITAQASYHAQYDWAIVEYLKQAGVQAEYMRLENRGIFGNGHMCFIEKNSDEVAAEIIRWIDSVGTQKEAGSENP
ncbi:Alpha/Beta hydrolase protein [Xylaria cf. heliscus]|nr:Alpha/Beta hydrolase protein [Xylaria cf. heliscus]